MVLAKGQRGVAYPTFLVSVPFDLVIGMKLGFDVVMLLTVPFSELWHREHICMYVFV